MTRKNTHTTGPGSENRATRTVLSLSALAMLITGAVLYAGPLDPPAGPVTSTFKTLTEVEPRTAINAANTPGDADSLFKITQPGSYYLTGNVTGVVGKHGIEIAASGVTLALMGFDLVGVPAMGAFDGVSVTLSGLTNIAVMNGSVRNWGDDGIDLFSSAAAGCRVEGLLASGNVDNGFVIGINSTTTNCSAHLNGFHGIYTDVGCTITNCSASGHNFIGIRAGGGGTVTNCSGYNNSGNGITIDTGSTVSTCSAFQNTGNGIVAASGSVVTNCSAFDNSASGISVSSGCTVADCTARSNTLDGIVCSSGCVIRGNTCAFNGSGGDGAGIHAISTDNRIEGNNCTVADRGIDVDGFGNIIIKNTCSGNTINWAIAANNYYGPIIDRTPIATIPVNGSSAVGTLATTDPHANFSY